MITELDLHLVQMHAAHMSKDAALKPVADAMLAEALRKVCEAIQAYQRVSPSEERAAWDAYVAGYLADPTDGSVREGAALADKMLAERRERFGGSR